MPDDSNQTQAPALRILSLDGDGISVLSELTIIRELMYRIQGKLGSQDMPRPCEWFQLIGGTGTGGLVAILLGRLRLSIDEATRCYLSIMGRVFDRKRGGPQDREQELELVLKEILERYCNDADAPMMDTYSVAPTCKVVVYAMPAASIQAATPTCIRTYRVWENQGLECSVFNAIRATTAMPGVLKRKMIYDGEVEVPYIGAGLGCNNPTAQMLVEAERAYPGWGTACVFSVGAGQLHPVGLREPKRLLDSMSSQLAAAAEAIAKDCERIHQDVAVRFSHTEELYFRFNPDQGMQDVDRSDSNRLPDVQTHAKAYLAGAATSGGLNKAVKTIVSGKGTAMLLNGNVILLLQNQLKIGRCPAPSAMFTGREELLELLCVYFFENSHKRHVFVLHGLGGAGKTQVALAFVHRYKKLFWDVFYIDATTHDTIRAGLKLLAKRAKAGDTHEDALDWLDMQEQRWLIVYNNADDPAIDLSDYFPKCAHGNILITTRNRRMILHSDPTSHCRVGDMQENDARMLLFKTSGIHRSLDSEATADVLIKHLGFHALAIVQAVGQTDGYKLTTYATWDVSYAQLLPLAAQLLRLMSFMHHDGISVKFFQVAAANMPEFNAYIPLNEEENARRDVAWGWLKSFMTSRNTWDTLSWDRLTNNLRSFSLLDYDPPSQTYAMHPLVHSWCRSAVPDPHNVREHAAWVLGLCVQWNNSSEDYAFRRVLLPHAMSLFATDDPITPALAVRLAWVFEDAGATNQAEKLHSNILRVCRERLGPDHARTLASMFKLAKAHKDLGRWNEAEAMLLEVLEVQKRVLGKDHPDLLSTMSSLASTYNSQGRWNEAETMLLEVLEVRTRVLGKDHPDLLSTMHELSSTYYSQKRWKEAEVLLVEVVEARKHVLGREHPHTMVSISLLASVYASQGRLSDAELLEVEDLETSKRVLGPKHPETLISMHNLARTYEDQGKLVEAERLMTEALELQKQVIGEQHPSTQLSAGALATIRANLDQSSNP